MESKKVSPKDVFMNLLGMLTLYVSAISLMALLFQYVNLAFPDALSYQSYGSVAGPIRWAMAALIIVFPVFILITRMLRKDEREHPEKREFAVKKWLVYFTLFVAAIVIVTDLVTLIYNFLGGELTMRFILKMLIVLFVATKVFWYYLWDLKEKFTAVTLRIALWGIIAVVVASVAGGFFTVASPLKARDYRFDEQRVMDLQNIQWQIINYWTQKGAIPKTLADLRDPISGFVVSADVESGAEYEYRAVNKLTFELCATFSLPAIGGGTSMMSRVPMPTKDPYLENWNHDIGRTCFERPIDPELYRKNPIPVPAQD